jgi:hypothetical protein
MIKKFTGVEGIKNLIKKRKLAIKEHKESKQKWIFYSRHPTYLTRIFHIDYLRRTGSKNGCFVRGPL